MSKTKRNVIIITAAVIAAIGIVLAIVLPLTLHRDETHTVTFNSNGGSVVNGIRDVPYNSLIDEPAAPTREGYLFAGWFSDVQLSKQWRFDKDKVKKDLTLYAKWNYNATSGLHLSLENGKEYVIRDIGSATNVRDLILPETFNNLPVTAIADNAFDGVKTIETVYIPKSIVSVGNQAFRDAENLTSVIFARGDTVLGSGLFDGCKKLQDVILPSALTKIPAQTFYECESITGINIPATVTEIGDFAFYRCVALTNAAIPEAVSSIGERAFAGCASIWHLILPHGLNSLGEAAFSGCSGLESLSVSAGAGASKYYADANCIIEIGTSDGQARNTLVLGCKNSNLTAITNPIHAIGDFAFSGCSGLANVYFPASVTEIGNHAFANCVALTSVNIPSAVVNVGDFAFSGCRELGNVTFGLSEGVQHALNRIGRESFSYCYKLNVVLPDSLEFIGAGAFYECGDSATVTYNGDSADLDKVKVERVPDGEEDLYTKTDFRVFYNGGNRFVNGIA